MRADRGNGRIRARPSTRVDSGAAAALAPAQPTRSPPTRANGYVTWPTHCPRNAVSAPLRTVTGCRLRGRTIDAIDKPRGGHVYCSIPITSRFRLDTLCRSIADSIACHPATCMRCGRKGRRPPRLRRRRTTAHCLERIMSACARRHRQVSRSHEPWNGSRAFRSTSNRLTFCVTTRESQTSSPQSGVTPNPCEVTWIACSPTTGATARALGPTSFVTCLHCANITIRLTRKTRQRGLLSTSVGDSGMNFSVPTITWSDLERLSLKDATVRDFIRMRRVDGLNELQILRAMVLRLIEEKHNLAHALIEAKAREAPRYLLDAE